MRHFGLLLLVLSCSLTAAQKKKPTLIILPSDSWCTQPYFMSNYDNQGLTVSVTDSQAAFREDLELRPVVSKAGELLTSYGYSLKDCEMELIQQGNLIRHESRRRSLNIPGNGGS